MAEAAERAFTNRRPPANELERELAIIWCRLNSHDRPMSNRPMTVEERAALRPSFSVLMQLVPHEVALWMWNEGQNQWRGAFAESEGAKP